MEISKIPIQETPLFHFNYDKHKDLNDIILSEIKEERKKDSKNMPSSNPGCWRSDFKYKCVTELFKPMQTIVQEWTKHYFSGVEVDARINYWTNVNEPGAANMMHHHALTYGDVSGVYYVQGTGTGAIRFVTHEQMHKLIPKGMPFSGWVGHEPKDGDILLFPSYLLHDVVPNPHKDRQRITIAFNAKLFVMKEKNK